MVLFLQMTYIWRKITFSLKAFFVNTPCEERRIQNLSNYVSLNKCTCPFRIVFTRDRVHFGKYPDSCSTYIGNCWRQWFIIITRCRSSWNKQILSKSRSITFTNLKKLKSFGIHRLGKLSENYPWSLKSSIVCAKFTAEQGMNAVVNSMS